MREVRPELSKRLSSAPCWDHRELRYDEASQVSVTQTGRRIFASDDDDDDDGVRTFADRDDDRPHAPTETLTEDVLRRVETITKAGRDRDAPTSHGAWPSPTLASDDSAIGVTYF